MAEKIYTLEQAAAKLGKTPDEFKEIAKQNNISELRKGADILYNAKDVDSLAASGSDDTVLNIEDSVIGLSDESSLLGLASLDEKDDDEFEIDADMSSMVELTEADTRAGLTDDKDDDAEDSILSLADSLSDEPDEPEAKINADADIDAGGADGSGSGLLDLSLQADDSQFGAVLDDILPGGDNDLGGFDDLSDSVPSAGNALADTDQQADTSSEPESEEPDVYVPEPVAPVAASTMPSGGVAYQQVAIEEPASGAFGVMMLLPVLTIILAMVVVTAGFKDVTPSMLMPVEGYLMYVIGGIAALALIIGVVGAVSGSAKGEKKPKVAKPKAPKKPKKK